MNDALKQLEAIRDDYRNKIAALDYAIHTLQQMQQDYGDCGSPYVSDSRYVTQPQQPEPPEIPKPKHTKKTNAYMPPQDKGGIRTDI